jgi:hypothetical protein
MRPGQLRFDYSPFIVREVSPAAGNTLLPMVAGQAHGSLLQERVIAVALRTGAVALTATAATIL